MKDKTFFKQSFTLGLYCYFRQISASIDRIGNNSWEDLTYYFKSRVMPEDVISYINNAISKEFVMDVPLSIEAYVNLYQLPEKVADERIVDLSSRFPKRDYWYKIRQLFQCNLKRDSCFTNEELSTILYLLNKFSDYLNEIPNPPLRKFTCLCIPISYTAINRIEPKLSSDNIKLGMEVECFNEALHIHSKSINEILGVAWPHPIDHV